MNNVFIFWSLCWTFWWKWKSQIVIKFVWKTIISQYFTLNQNNYTLLKWLLWKLFSSHFKTSSNYYFSLHLYTTLTTEFIYLTFKKSTLLAFYYLTTFWAPCILLIQIAFTFQDLYLKNNSSNFTKLETIIISHMNQKFNVIF